MSSEDSGLRKTTFFEDGERKINVVGIGEYLSYQFNRTPGYHEEHNEDIYNSLGGGRNWGDKVVYLEDDEGTVKIVMSEDEFGNMMKYLDSYNSRLFLLKLFENPIEKVKSNYGY